MDLIPFNKPEITEKELSYLRQTIENGHISGDGAFTQNCHRLLESALGVPKVLLTTSGTHALEMMALLLDLKPGDEFIVPSFTFSSTVNAFLLRGARPVFVDIRKDTLNLDEKQIEAKITKKTRAIVVMHYGGVGVEMSEVMRLAEERKIPVVEDNAHGLFGTYRDKQLGTFGVMGALSFHETKNFISGEGGALLINQTDLIERAEILREKGTNRSRFFRGQIDKYTWVDIGSSYLPSDMLAAILFAQLERKEKIQSDRKRLWHRYFDCLQTWAAANDVRLPFVPAHCGQAYHLFYFLMPTPADRDGILTYLRKQNICATFHYVPLDSSEMGRQFCKNKEITPNTLWISERLVRLPFFNTLSVAQQDRVVEAVCSYKMGRTNQRQAA